MNGRIARFALVLFAAIATDLAFGEVRKALVIGISDYPNYSDNPIKFAHIDALRFKDFLESDGAGRVKVSILTNGEATKDAIWEEVDKLKYEQPRPDTLFVFFSGHAELDTDTDLLYLMPTAGDRKHLSSTGILATEFITKLKALAPTNLLIFLDACHSGAVILGKGGPGSTESFSGSLDGLIASLNKGNEGGVMAFVSAAKDERSWEDEDNAQGIFTRFLIKGLEGEADGVGDKKDGKITAGELENFLIREVPNRALALGKLAQHPVVSPDFKGAYVIAVVPSTPEGSSGTKLGLKIDISQLEVANPELALMVRAGIVLHSSSLIWSAENNNIVRSFELARPVKAGTLPTSIRPESLISPVISSDDSLLVACIEPASIVSISLKSDATVSRQPIQLAGASNPRARILDSCDISISRDHRYAIARLRTIDGKSRLSLVALDGEQSPPFTVASYETGVFLGDVLLLGQADTLTVVRAGTWAPVFTKSLVPPYNSSQVLPPLRALIADPESTSFAELRDDRTIFYPALLPFHDSEPLTIRVDTGFRGQTACYVSGDSLYCVDKYGWKYRDTKGAGGSGGFGCGNGGARGFPSTSSSGAHSWPFFFQCAAEPETLHFIRGVEWVEHVRMPEPILTARLLANGKVTAVGQRGGIYTLDSQAYGDCCSLQAASPNITTRISAGNDGVTAILELDSDAGALSVFRGNSLVKRLTLSDVGWVKNLTLSESNQLVALIGDTRLRLIEFASGDYQRHRARDIDCGMPVSIDKSDSTLVCVAPETQRIQQRSIATGKVQREFDQHVGPVQQVYLNGMTVTAAGTFTGRSQTLVTVWNVSNGKVVSQRYCSVGGSQAEKPFSLFRHGSQFAQLDTPSRLLTRQSLTCESGKPMLVSASLKMLQTSSAADVVAFVDERPNVFHAGNPGEPGFVRAWDLALPIEDIAVSPDGADVVVVVGGRILRIPITVAGFLHIVKQRIPREFTGQECDEFFTGGGCPILKR